MMSGQANLVHTSLTVFGAQDALDHITGLETEIKHTLSAHSLLDKSILVVGFDEYAVAQEWGLLQRVYLLLSVEPDDDLSLCDQLGRLFSPYPGTIITPTKVQPTPVFDEEGRYYEQEELISTRTERFDSVAKDECLILSEGCKLHFSREQISVADTLDGDSQPPSDPISSRGQGRSWEAPRRDPDERSRGNHMDTSSDHGGEAGRDERNTIDRSHATEHHTQGTPINPASTSDSGGEPHPGRSDIDSLHSVSFEVKTDVYLDSPARTNTSMGAPAYQSIQMNGSVIYEVS